MDNSVLYYSGSKTDFFPEVDNPLKVILSYKRMYANEPVESPLFFVEFHERLVQVMTKIFERNFGLQHYLEGRKEIKCKPSIETLIEVECKLEKQRTEETLIINPKLDPYQFLKLALERNCPFSVRDQHFLGVFIDRSGVNKSQKLIIGIQAAAQVLWYKKGSSIPFIYTMREEIWRDDKILSFLGLFDSQSLKAIKLNKRNIENYIRLVCPIPKDKRKQKPSKRDKLYFSKIVTIPGIFLSNPTRINFLKLRLAVMALTKILSFFGLSLEEIQADPIFLAYKEPLRFYLKDYVIDWIEEGFVCNGSILDLS